MSFMHAKERLYLTSDRKALVREGDPFAATLYVGPGDEIPESAVRLFGLVDGTLGDGVVAIVDEIEGGLLRVRLVDGRTGDAIGVADLHFTQEFRIIVGGEIDEGQLLEILKEPRLAVEAALIGDPSPGWVEFPGRDKAIIALQERVDDDIRNGRAHDLVGDATQQKLAELDAKEEAPRPDKEQAPGQDKEQVPGEDKGAGSGTKGAVAPAVTEAPAADDLTKVRGIGPSSANGFIAAGFTTFAQLAAIDPANPPSIAGLGVRTNWETLTASAAELVAPAEDNGQGSGAASGDANAEAGATGQKAD